MDKKKFIEGVAVVVIQLLIWVLIFLVPSDIFAQDVKREGNTFTQVSTHTSGSKEIPTDYTYVDSKGKSYQVFLSASGKAFIKKVSKKSGKEYKQYLPEIGRQINPEAYEEKPKDNKEKPKKK